MICWTHQQWDLFFRESRDSLFLLAWARRRRGIGNGGADWPLSGLGRMFYQECAAGASRRAVADGAGGLPEFGRLLAGGSWLGEW